MSDPRDLDESELEMLVGQIADDFTRRCRLGEAPALEEYTARYPHVANLLQDILPALAALKPTLPLGGDLNADTSPLSLTIAANASSFKEAAAIDAHDPTQAPWPASFQRDYEILGELGTGAMGIVYQARHRALKRVVALKVMRQRSDEGQYDLERFRNEAELIARLQHPSFVQIFEVREIDGRACLALEYVEGGTLAARTRGAPQPPREAARLVESLARAMSVAHAQGLIHRDLKPANILMTPGGVAKISDFGLAKRLQDDVGLTQVGAIVGTPSYMSPEQASGAASLGPGVDIFALGAILYELLVGRPPFKGVSILETLDQVRLTEPVPPARLQPKCPRDLETICLKCLEKDPARRYATAADLADDLARFLADRPILARSVTTRERIWRWCRRNPILATACGAILILVMSLAGGSFLVAMRLENDNSQLAAKTALAEENEQKANHHAARSQQGETRARAAQQEAQNMSAGLALDKGLSYCESGEVDRGLLWLIRALELAPPDATHLDGTIRANLRDWQGQVRKLRWVFHHGDKVSVVALSPDGKTLVTAGKGDRLVRFWNMTDFSPIDRTLHSAGDPAEKYQLPGGRGEITCAAISADGKWLLTGASDRTARLWHFESGQQSGAPWQHEGQVTCLALGRDGKLAVTGSKDGSARLWDVESGRLLDRLELQGPLFSVAISPRGDRFVTSSHGPQKEKGTRIWETATRQLQTLDTDFAIGGFVPGSNHLLLDSGAGSQHLMDATTGKRVSDWYEQAEQPNGLEHGITFSADGQLFATTTRSGSVWISSTKSLAPLGRPVLHSDAANSAAFAPTGTLLVSGSSDGTARIWDYATQQPRGVRLALPGNVLAAYDLSGTRIVLGSVALRQTRLWDVAQRRVVREFATEGVAWACGFDPTSESLYTGTREGKLGVWDTRDGTAAAWPVPSQKLELFPRFLVVSPDGRTVALGTHGWQVHVWNKADGQLRFPMLIRGPLSAVAFSPDSRLLLVGDEYGLVELRETLTGRVVHQLKHLSTVKDAIFSADGTTVLVATANTRVFRWSVSTGQPMDQLLDQPDWSRFMALSPNGRWLATGRSGLVRLWDLNSGRCVFQPISVSGSLKVLTFRPDGQQLLVGTDQEIWLFDLPQPVEGTVERLKLWIQVITSREMADDQGATQALSGVQWHERRKLLEALGGPPAR